MPPQRSVGILFSSADESGEESWEEFPASDDSSENTDGSTDESADGDISEVGGTDNGDGSDSSAEITDISQLNTDFLGDDAKAKFEKAKTFCQGEYSGDEDAISFRFATSAFRLVTCSVREVFSVVKLSTVV